MAKQSAEYYHDQVRSLVRLPTLPAIATEILQITRDDRLSVHQMLPILEKDPPLAMRVMKTANSAYYAVRQKVESLGRAVVVIGMEELSYIALSFSIIGSLSPGSDGSNRQIKWERFWEHSIAVGHLARVLNRRYHVSDSSGHYAMGLMHDIGKLVLFRLDPDLFYQAYRLVKEKQLTSIESEMEVFGITHQDAGGWMAEKWELPPSLLSAIAYHHNPEQLTDSETRKAVALISLADKLCIYRSFRFGTGFLNEIPPADPAIEIIQSAVNGKMEMDIDSLALIIDEEIDSIKELAKLMEAQR